LTKQEKINIGIASIGLITSIIAIIVSFNSNRISNEAYKLSQNEYFSDRRILLKSIKKNGYLELIPISSEQSINNLTIFFPSKFGFQPKVLTPPNLKIYNTLIDTTLKNYIDEITPDTEDYASLRPNFPFPILIATQGYTKGTASMTFGIYDIYVSYIKVENASSVEIQSIALKNYMNINTNPQKSIDKIFNEFQQRIKRQANKDNKYEETNNLP